MSAHERLMGIRIFFAALGKSESRCQEMRPGRIATVYAINGDDVPFGVALGNRDTRCRAQEVA